MDNKTKFQTISRKFTWKELHDLDTAQNNGTAKGFCDVDFSIDENLDKRYNKCVGISIKTTGDFTTNVNGEVTQPILIDDVEIFPTGFDTNLVFPMEQNREFTHFKYPIALNNSKCEGRIKFHFSGFGTTQPSGEGNAKILYVPQVVLHLENREDKKEITLGDIKATLDSLVKIVSSKK